MQRYTNICVDRRGNVLPGAQVLVYVGGTAFATLATVYSDNGVTAVAQPLVADSAGEFYFYAADGQYDLVVAYPGMTNKIRYSIELADLTPYAFDVTSVRFGAVGDGATDDAAAIQAAIDVASSAKGTVFIGGGKCYRVGATIMLDDDVTIEGDGTLVRDDTLAGFTMRADEKENITIRGIRFEGAGSGVYEPNATYTHIIFYGCKNVLIDGIYSLNASSDDIYIGTRAGFHNSTPEYNRVVNCHLEGAERASVVISSGRGILVANNTMLDCCGASIDIEPYSDDQVIDGIEIIGNFVRTTSTQTYNYHPARCIDAQFEPNRDNDGIVVEGNYFELALDSPDSSELDIYPSLCTFGSVGSVSTPVCAYTITGNVFKSNILTNCEAGTGMSGNRGIVNLRRPGEFIFSDNQVIGPEDNTDGNVFGVPIGLSIVGGVDIADERIVLIGNRVTGWFEYSVWIEQVDGMVFDNVVRSDIGVPAVAVLLKNCNGVLMRGAYYGAYTSFRFITSTDILFDGVLAKPSDFVFMVTATGGANSASALGIMSNRTVGAFPGAVLDKTIVGPGTLTLNEVNTVPATLP